MIFKNQFQSKIFKARNSGERHPAFDNNAPLTISEMFHRAVNGIPLSCFVPKSERVPINGNFFTEHFDSLDFVIRNNARLTEEQRLKALEEHERLNNERAEYERLKHEQDLQHAQSVNV